MKGFHRVLVFLGFDFTYSFERHCATHDAFACAADAQRGISGLMPGAGQSYIVLGAFI